MIKNKFLLLSLFASLVLGVFFGRYLFSFYKGPFLTNHITEPNISKAIDISLNSFETNELQTDFHLPPVVASKNNIDKILSSKQIQNRLKTLTIEGTDLSVLEGKVDNLTNLSYLSLIDCASNHQPISVYKLSTLTYLEIGNCNLQSISPQVANLSSIVSLKLYRNNISELTNDLMSLTNLELLDLRDNDLTSIPPVLYQMPNLKEVYLEGNKINKSEIKLFQEYLTNRQVLVEDSPPSTITE